MFDVKAKRRVIVNGMDVHSKFGQLTVTVFTKTGSHIGYNDDPSKWILILPPTIIQGQGKGKLTSLPTALFTPVRIEGGSVQAFYVTFYSPDLRYTLTDQGLGDVFIDNDDLALLVGSGIGTKTFGASFSPRLWNGLLHYELVNSDEKLALSPQSIPSNASTKIPTKSPPRYLSYHRVF